MVEVHIMATYLSLGLSILALILTFRFYRLTYIGRRYSSLDRLYLSLYQQAMDHPYVLDPEFTTNYKEQEKDKRLVYESYAFQAWMIVESVIDLYSDSGFKDKHYKTWKVVIKTEAELHLTWLLDESQKNKFKEDFLTHIKDIV